MGHGDEYANSAMQVGEVIRILPGRRQLKQ